MQESESLVMIQIQDRNGVSETISAPERLEPYGRVNFLSSQPYRQVLRVYRFDGQTRSILTTYHPNGTLWQFLEAKEMRAFGIFRQWFACGTKEMEATVLGGTADLTPSAQKTWLFDGMARVWDEGGQCIAEIQYDKGVLSGLSRYYYSTGHLKQEISFLQGEKHGTCMGYRSGGVICWKEEYDKGLLRKAAYYDASQQLIANVEEGEGLRALFDGERVAEVQEIHEGKVEGLIRRLDAEGGLSSQFTLKNGKKQGEEWIYFKRKETATEPLQPKLLLTWDEDMLHGKVRSWYPTGQVQSEREMIRNKRSGPLLAWYRNGSIMLVEEYENDQLENGLYYRKNRKDPISSIVNGTGMATLYDEDGVLRHKVQYVKGKIIDPE
jgi:antitoxin component YwqK of YwqJK toxin-antitoxin module